MVVQLRDGTAQWWYSSALQLSVARGIIPLSPSIVVCCRGMAPLGALRLGSLAGAAFRRHAGRLEARVRVRVRVRVRARVRVRVKVRVRVRVPRSAPVDAGSCVTTAPSARARGPAGMGPSVPPEGAVYPGTV